MSTTFFRILLGGILFLSVLADAHSASREAPSILTLARAEQLALDGAPSLARRARELAAAQEQIVYAERLPDPQLSVGLLNVPVDSLRLDEQDMSMMMVGIRQQLPPGDTLALRGDQARSRATQSATRLRAEERELLRRVRETWFDLYYLERSLETLNALRPLYANALGAAEGRYRAGAESLQTVIAARQRNARLTEREHTLRAELARARAELSRWIGDAAFAPVGREQPTLAELPPDFDPSMHPEIAMATAGVDEARIDVALARQEYKPGIMVDVSYGARQHRPDLVSAVVSVDLPLFTRSRQDRRVAERRELAAGAEWAREERQRELRARYRAAQALASSLDERLALYTQRILPDAERATQLTVSGFARDQNILREARIDALETRLEFERLRSERAKVQAELLYLTGDHP